METQNEMTYAGTGVNYDDMDPFKIACQKRAAKTADNAKRLGFTSQEWTRGESAYMVGQTRGDRQYLSHVEEGLGTKNLVADAMMKITGKSYYDQIAQCTIAMIVNDMITLGCLPITVAMHLAVGSSEWFQNEQRVKDLVEGWGNACDLAGAIWSGGETPTLKDIIYPEASLLSGSAIGIYQSGFGLPGIEDGDAIIIMESSGIHANGLTLTRDIAKKLPNGYQTLLSDGRMYGEALLDPTHIYVKFIEECIKRKVNIHYSVNITGHGWRKLMRSPESFSYVIDELPNQLPIFDFIQKNGPVSDKEAYGNLNMGAGFALFVPQSEIPKIPYDSNFKFRRYIAGYVEKSNVKKVVIQPKNLEYRSETLAVR